MTDIAARLELMTYAPEIRKNEGFVKALREAADSIRKLPQDKDARRIAPGMEVITDEGVVLIYDCEFYDEVKDKSVPVMYSEITLINRIDGD